jgi:hypothetical protein
MRFSRSSHSRSKKALQPIARASFELLESRRLLTGTVAVWTGAAGNGLFSAAANWQGDVVPTPAQDVDFPAGVTNADVTVDSNVIVGNVEVDASYTLASKAGTTDSLTIDGNLTATDGVAVIKNPVVLGANSVFLVDDAAGVETDGVISDGGHGFGIDKQGNGELRLAGSGDTYTGTTTDDGGVLIDTAPLVSILAVNSGTTFYGSSSIASIAGFSGTFSPATFDSSTQTSAPATLTVDHGIDFGSPSGATINFDLDGPDASSQIVVTAGTISLGDTTFSPTVINNFTPSPGAVITLIQNNTGAAITGTFLNLAQGATTTIGGTAYTISYTGGSNGQDVTLTAPGTAVNPSIVSATTSASTHGYTIAADVVATDTSTGGTAGLTYTWSAIHLPSGGKEPTYNHNGTNASGSVVARFFKDGTYVLRCTVKDENGSVATADVLVVVSQKATAMRLEPHGAKIAPKATEQYTATVLDQFGHPLRTVQTITYSVPSGGGTISSTGLFTAGDTAEKVDIEAESDNLAGIDGASIT